MYLRVDEEGEGGEGVPYDRPVSSPSNTYHVSFPPPPLSFVITARLGYG